MRSLIIILFCSTLNCLAYSQTDETVYQIAEKMPLYGDCAQLTEAVKAQVCSEQAVLQFISRNIKYPPLAQENSLQGLVIVQFTVNKDGSTTDHKVIKDIGGGCGKEALRVVQMMKGWNAATIKSQAVRALMTLPIRFRLEGEAPAELQHTLYLGTYAQEQISKADLEKALVNAPIVRDAAGNACKIQSLSLTIEGKRKPTTISTNGDLLTKQMQRLAKKAKRGGSALLEAKVTQEGKVYTAQRLWTVK
jgi:TonB family protein